MTLSLALISSWLTSIQKAREPTWAFISFSVVHLGFHSFLIGCHFFSVGSYFSQQVFSICSIFIVWQYNFLLRPPIQQFDQSNPTSYTSCHVYEWLQTGYGLVIGFTEHIQIVTTSNYSATANSHSAVHYSTY
jgi:hypothetical protein